MTDSDIEERLDALEDKLNSLETSQQAYRDHVVKPRLDDLEAESDDARADRAELRATVQDLQHQVAQLQAELESITGLADHEDTSPDKRTADLRQTMIRRAQARTDAGEGYHSMWWQECQKLFADLGHGEISKPDCYKAMRDAADADGFEVASKVNENGAEVKAIRVDISALPAVSRSRSPTTPDREAAGQNPTKEGVEGNLD